MSNYINKKYIVKIMCFVAILAILAQISLFTNLGININLMLFGLVLCGYILGPISSCICVSLYLILGIIGVPIFPSLSHGIRYISGINGGFMLSYFIIVIISGIVGRLQSKIENKTNIIWSYIIVTILLLIGLTLYYMIGVIWFMDNLSQPNKQMYTLSLSLNNIVFPYLIKDILSILFALILAYNLMYKLPTANDLNQDSE